MQHQAVLKIVGILLTLFSTTLLPPLAISIVSQDGSTQSFVIAYLITLAVGLLFWLPVHRHRNEPRLRDGFLIVVLFWSVLAGFGAIPFLLSIDPAMSLPDAVFESMSGSDHDRGNCANRTGSSTDLSFVLPATASMARWYGHHRAGRSSHAHAGYWGDATLPSRGARPCQG